MSFCIIDFKEFQNSKSKKSINSQDLGLFLNESEVDSISLVFDHPWDSLDPNSRSKVFNTLIGDQYLFYGTRSKDHNRNILYDPDPDVIQNFSKYLKELTFAPRTAGNKELMILSNSSQKSIQDQISQALACQYIETKSLTDYLNIEYYIEDLILLGQNSTIQIFGIWLKTHKNIEIMINQILVDIFYGMILYDPVKMEGLDLNNIRDSEIRKSISKIPILDLIQKVMNQEPLSRDNKTLLNFFGSNLEKIKLELEKAWNQYLSFQNIIFNPFWILQKEMLLLFGLHNPLELNFTNVLEHMSLSKNYFIWYLWKKVRVGSDLSKYDSKHRTRVLKNWL